MFATGLQSTGTRTKLTYSGFFASQLATYGSNAKQCGQPYQKTSATSTLSGGELVG
jgi:hypothetical protein